MLLSRYVVAQIILKFGCWLSIQLARRKNGSNTNTGRGEKPTVLIFYSFLPEGNFGLLQVFTCWSQMTFDSTCLNCWKLFITSHDNQILYCRTLQTVVGSLWRGSLHIWDKCVTPSLSEGIKCIAGKVTIQQFQV